MSSINSNLEKRQARLDNMIYDPRRDLQLATQPIYAATPPDRKAIKLVTQAAHPIDELKAELGIKPLRWGYTLMGFRPSCCYS